MTKTLNSPPADMLSYCKDSGYCMDQITRCERTSQRSSVLPHDSLSCLCEQNRCRGNRPDAFRFFFLIQILPDRFWISDHPTSTPPRSPVFLCAGGAMPARSNHSRASALSVDGLLREAAVSSCIARHRSSSRPHATRTMSQRRIGLDFVQRAPLSIRYGGAMNNTTLIV